MRDATGLDGFEPSREAASLVRFAGLVLDLDACMLSRETGEAVPLTRSELALLTMFVSRPGRVLSRDALLDAFADRHFEPFDRSVDVLVGKLRRKIEPDAKEPRLIVTVPGVGYRFDGLRRAPEIAKLDADSAAKREGAGPPRLSIVVLPFANLCGDPEQEYFADGVTESLTTDLSRISGAFVIGRGTAFAYKGKTADVRRIGRELNVRYALEGSVQRDGNRMRVNVQLIEAETGAHLWAERFDKPVADLFDMQDEIVARLASELKTALIDAEARRGERAPNPDSMDLYFQGRAVYNRGFTPAALANARAFYVRALELDPGNVEAQVGVATVDVTACVSYLMDDPHPALADAEARLTKALAAAPNHALAHLVMGVALRATDRTERSIEEMERALAIDPNMATARALIGSALIWMGKAEEAEPHVLEALRMSPRDPMIFEFFLVAGIAKAYLGEFADAAAWLRKSTGANRNRPIAFFLLGASLAHLGRLDEARREVDAGLAVDPKFTLRRYCAGLHGTNAVFLAQRERVIEGMRRAGVPDG